MQGTDVLLSLAEIAGVFVGFGALIAVRSGGASDVREVAYIRSVLAIGVWVVMASLVPVTLGGYDIGEREVWLVSGLIALVSGVAVWVVNYRTADMQAVSASMTRTQMLLETTGYALLFWVALAALILVVLGLLPDQEPALYLTAVVLALFVAALSLLWLVFAQRRPATASDEAVQTAE